MKRFLLYCFFHFLLTNVPFSQTVVSIRIDGTINPVSADFINNSIKKAYKNKAECIIIHLNTPGWLLKSTRVIVCDILQ